MSLLWKIERFLRASDIPPTKFGRLTINDPRLIADLRNGREPRPSTIARIEAFIASEGPAQ